MIKKIVVILLSVLFILSSIIVVSADETTSSTSVNTWTWRDFKAHFGDELDFSNIDFDTVPATLSSEVGFLILYSDIFAFYYSDGSITPIGDDDHGFTFSDKISCADFTIYGFSNSTNYNAGNFTISDPSENNPLIITDLTLYNQYLALYPDLADFIYYCPDFVSSFKAYVDNKNYDFNPVLPPEDFSNNAIKYSNYADCPYGKYGAEPYETETENFVSAGLFTDWGLYYDSDFVTDGSYDHNEDITFYVPIESESFWSGMSKVINLEDYVVDPSQKVPMFLIDRVSDLVIQMNDNKTSLNIDEFINEHFRAVHYENDVFSPLDFFNYVYGEDYTSFNDIVSFVHIGSVIYFKFTLSSHYSITHTNVGTETGSSNLTNTKTLFTGTRITHTAIYINPVTGETGSSGDGLGSDISQADDSLSRPPTRDELEDMGFENGFQNTEGSFPYKVTIYRNGTEYFQMYFSKKPSVSSYYYTDKCIDYGINIENMKIYMYFKEQNMSKVFDFTDETIDDMNTTDTIISDIPDLVDILGDEGVRLFRSLLNVDTSEFNNTYTIHMWTNYTGEFPDNYNGFYCKFNWDLETSGHFQKNNSDDDYDYSQDYEPDEGFTDNNGNVHGGAVEQPTEDSTYNGFNNEDFSFDENGLWSYANSFLNFVSRAFKCLPEFVWQLIACSIVIIIILRILGR